MRRQIAIDLRKINDSGIGTYIRNTIPRIVKLLPDIVFHLIGRREAIKPWFDISQSQIALIETDLKSLSIVEQFVLPWLIPSKIDLYWATHFNVPLFYSGRLIVTIHDILPMVRQDLAGGMAHDLYTRVMVSAIRSRAKRVLSVSEFTSHELVKFGKISPDRITHAPNGVDDTWRAVRPESRPYSRPFLLYVGNIKPNKNLKCLLAACKRVFQVISHLDLVVVGERERIVTRDNDALCLASELGDRVIFTGYVSDNDLKQYFAFADALVFPSKYEGFGLPPLEAMAAGCPVISSSAASLPEVCGNAALYFDPDKPDELAEQILRMCGDAALRNDLIERGRKNTQRFDWNHTAETCAAKIVEALE